MSAFAVGMTVGATLRARNPISRRRGTYASRPASSPQSVTGRPPASAQNDAEQAQDRFVAVEIVIVDRGIVAVPRPRCTA